MSSVCAASRDRDPYDQMTGSCEHKLKKKLNTYPNNKTLTMYFSKYKKQLNCNFELQRALSQGHVVPILRAPLSDTKVCLILPDFTHQVAHIGM